MTRIRIILAIFLLAFAPLSGALAAALGASAAHHYCDDVWHGHAEGIVHAGEDCDSPVPDLAGSSCEDCQIATAVFPLTAFVIVRPEPADFTVPDVWQAQAGDVISLFRPPII